MNRFDVEAYFKERGYKVTNTKGNATDPEYMVEKNGVKHTVDVVDHINMHKSISQFVYDRIMAGGLYAVRPLIVPKIQGICVYTKKDIKKVAKTYFIWWNDTKSTTTD